VSDRVRAMRTILPAPGRRMVPWEIATAPNARLPDPTRVRGHRLCTTEDPSERRQLSGIYA
jgi:hypothetical protein